MIGLASALLALAGVFAERAVATARRDGLGERLGIRRTFRPALRPPPPVLWSAGALAGAVAASLVMGPAVAVVALATIGSVRLVSVRRRRATARRRADEQLADMVSAMSAGLRAGLSLTQSLGYARDEAQEPLRADLAALVGRIEVGTPVGEALSVWAETRASEDARLIVGVLDLHRRSGGDLPAVLDGLAAALRERRAAHREVRALTAQARLSGTILGLLPIGFFGFLLATSRHEMLTALATPIGGTAIAIGLGMELLAFLWIRHLLEVR